MFKLTYLGVKGARQKVRVRALSSDDYVAGSLLPVLLPCATCSWEPLGQCPVIVSLMSALLSLLVLVGESRRVQRLSCTWLSKRAVDKRRKENPSKRPGRAGANRALVLLQWKLLSDMGLRRLEMARALLAGYPPRWPIVAQL